MTGTRWRIGAALAAAGLLTTAVTGLGAGAAGAKPVGAKEAFSTQCGYLSDTREWQAVAYDASGHYIGQALFDQDPVGERPGDALYATDAYADGWGVIAHLSDGRTATTAGHTAGYTTPAVLGDLPEDHAYLLWVEMVKGDDSVTLASCPARS